MGLINRFSQWAAFRFTCMSGCGQETHNTDWSLNEDSLVLISEKESDSNRSNEVEQLRSNHKFSSLHCECPKAYVIASDIHSISIVRMCD